MYTYDSIKYNGTKQTFSYIISMGIFFFFDEKSNYCVCIAFLPNLSDIYAELTVQTVD